MKLFIILSIAIIVSSCNNNRSVTKEKRSLVLTTDNLQIVPVSPNVYSHISYLQTESFGKVPCNGMIVVDNNEAVIFDTPTNDTVANQLISWLTDSLGYTIKAVVATHFHDDCLGGLQAFHLHHIPSYANAATITLAIRDSAAIPQQAIHDSLWLTVGNKKVISRYFGKGHTQDNIVAYYPDDAVLFGGCLLKEIDATKGYLGDADTSAWPATVKLIQAAYPDIKTVIPGHGAIGDASLLDYTIRLFDTNK